MNIAWSRYRETPRGRYGVALAAVFATVGLKLTMSAVWGPQPLLLMFFAAIMLSAWFGGRGPGLCATLLSALACEGLLLMPNRVTYYPGFSAHLALLLLVAEGGLISWLCGLLHESKRRVEQVASNAEQTRESHEQRARELAEANRLKDEFLATVSHELRTPLNSILGWTQLLRGGKLDEDEAAHALETIEQSAKNQARLIEDLLDVSRIITGKMRLEIRPVQLSQVIDAAIEILRPAADAKEIDIETTLDGRSGTVFGDPSRLQQVIWNLLSNAIKFTPRGGSVHIRLGRRDSHVELAVSDTGIGIEPSFLPHIFDPFRQADSSSTRAHKGLGLGLAIVRRLVELHGGTVTAESLGPARGTTIRVHLPMTAVSTTAKSPIRHRATETNGDLSLRGVRVVVVDDDPGARELLTCVLRQNGADVTVAASAAEGLAAVRRVHPDVLLSDIEMPEEDGYALLRQVRALPPEQGGCVPALALTAYARADDCSRALAAGFRMHLAKPIAPADLTTAICEVVRSGGCQPPSVAGIHRRVGQTSPPA